MLTKYLVFTLILFAFLQGFLIAAASHSSKGSSQAALSDDSAKYRDAENHRAVKDGSSNDAFLPPEAENVAV